MHSTLRNCSAVYRFSWRRKWQPTPVLLPGKLHGQRSLVGYSPWGRKESDTTERLYSLTYSFLSHVKWLRQLFFYLPLIPPTHCHFSVAGNLLLCFYTRSLKCEPLGCRQMKSMPFMALSVLTRVYDGCNSAEVRVGWSKEVCQPQSVGETLRVGTREQGWKRRRKFKRY